MIKARHHWVFTRFFNWYVPRIMKKDFAKIEVDGSWESKETSALIIGNHISWWDGFWVLYLNNRFLKKKLHVMMLEEQLKPRKFLNKTGAYSIHPGSRSALESLNYTAALLHDKQNSVLLFPQGEIVSTAAKTPVFEKGIQRVLAKTEAAQLLFYVAFVDYFSNRKPSLFFYLKELEFKAYSADELQELYASFYDEAKIKQAHKIA